MPIRCECDTVIAEHMAHFLRYKCRDRRCVGDTGDRVRVVYLDLRYSPPRIVAEQDVVEEASNG